MERGYGRIISSSSDAHCSRELNCDAPSNAAVTQLQRRQQQLLLLLLMYVARYLFLCTRWFIDLLSSQFPSSSSSRNNYAAFYTYSNNRLYTDIYFNRNLLHIRLKSTSPHAIIEAVGLFPYFTTCWCWFWQFNFNKKMYTNWSTEDQRSRSCSFAISSAHIKKKAKLLRWSIELWTDDNNRSSHLKTAAVCSNKEE